MPITVYLQIALATFLWGTAIPVAKSTFIYSPPLTLAGLRFMLAGLMLLAFSAAVTPWRRVRGLQSPDIGDQPPSEDTRLPGAQWPRVFLVGLLSTAIFYGLFFLGLNRTSASSGAVMDGVGPIISALMAHFVLHGDRLTGRRLFAIVTAFAGVCVIAVFRPALSGRAAIDPLGCLLILLGLIVGSSGTMLVITYRGRLGLMRLTGCQMCLGAILLLIIAHFAEGDRWRWSLAYYPPFVIRWLWLSMVSAVAFRLWYGLIRRYKVTSLSVFSFMTATWGAILSIMFLGDPLTPQLAIGGTLVIGGVILMNLDRTGHERELPPETEP